MIRIERKRLSNGKKKGENCRKNGNKYSAWAYVGASLTEVIRIRALLDLNIYISR